MSGRSTEVPTGIDRLIDSMEDSIRRSLIGAIGFGITAVLVAIPLSFDLIGEDYAWLKNIASVSGFVSAIVCVHFLHEAYREHDTLQYILLARVHMKDDSP